MISTDAVRYVNTFGGQVVAVIQQTVIISMYVITMELSNISACRENVVNPVGALLSSAVCKHITQSLNVGLNIIAVQHD